MPSSFFKIFPFFLIILVFACKKKESETVVPDPLTRQFQLQYTDQSTDNISFASLNENEISFTYSWADAKMKADRIHFGFVVGFVPGLISPKDMQAATLYTGANGVASWDANVLAGVTFDGGAAPNVDFDALTIKDIDNGVPDSGFGGDDKTGIVISEGQIIRFVQKDIQNATKYKGYFRIGTINLLNDPKTVIVQTKYIKK